MPADAGPFESFYASPAQHPGLLWLAAALALAVVLTRSPLAPSMRRYCIALVALSFLDAWLTTNEVFGLGPLEGWLASAVPLFFVIAGDLRYWLLVMLGDERGAIRFAPDGVGRALALSLIVPVSTQIVMSLLPESRATPRVMFLVYEVSFALLTIAMMRFHPKLVASEWLRAVSRFVVLYYGLWATADVLILAFGSDLGFALRVVPNMLYYGGLIAVMAICSSRATTRG